MRTVKWKYVAQDLQVESLVFKDLVHFTSISLLFDWKTGTEVFLPAGF